MENTVAVRMKNITKTFGSVIANKDVCLDVYKGEILSLLGENGSGKTTLMNMLSGIYFPDSGEIFIDGNAVTIASPKDAFALGIGMIHQHFKLIDVLTAAENVVLGLEESGNYSIKKIAAKVADICAKYGFYIDPMKKVYDMSVSEKQTLEIVKVLYRGANILILDEPTAVLTPQETEKLFDVIRNMKKDGKSVIIITHKLHEVLAISDRVAVLRKGEYIGAVATKDATELSLTEMMVGKKVELNISRPDPVNPQKRLEVRNLTCYSREGVKVLDDVSFDAYAGEILGIAGIAGSGQKELLEAISGLQPITPESRITYIDPATGTPVSLIGKSVKAIRNLGVSLSFVPEDRLGMGLVG
ncbi:MAG: ABC transporter ATP-binding protein, partial [Eubacteriales bacterium]